MQVPPPSHQGIFPSSEPAGARCAELWLNLIAYRLQHSLPQFRGAAHRHQKFFARFGINLSDVGILNQSRTIHMEGQLVFGEDWARAG